MSAARIVLVRRRGFLSRVACAFGIHNRALDPSPADFEWCLRCGAVLTTGWCWAGSSHQGEFSLVTYRPLEARP